MTFLSCLLSPHRNVPEQRKVCILFCRKSWKLILLNHIATYRQPHTIHLFITCSFHPSPPTHPVLPPCTSCHHDYCWGETSAKEKGTKRSKRVRVMQMNVWEKRLATKTGTMNGLMISTCFFLKSFASLPKQGGAFGGAFPKWKHKNVSNIYILISHCYSTCHHNFEVCTQKAVLAKMRADISLELHTNQHSEASTFQNKTQHKTKQTPEKKSLRIDIATVKIIAVC